MSHDEDAWPCVTYHRHEPDRPRRALDSLYVCAGCLSSLEQALAEMPAHYEALARRLAPGKGASGPQITGSREKALPIDPTVADHRSDLRGKLASWASMVAEERGISGPRSSDAGPVATWLLVHLRWACAQPWVDEYASELRSLRSRSLSLLYPTGRRRVEVGPCVEEGCDGVLTATIAPVDDMLPSTIGCSHDGDHAWEAPEWHLLGRKLHGAVDYGSRIAAAFRGLDAS